MEALERKSQLCIKEELTDLTGTLSSTTTAVTGVGTKFASELQKGSVIGTAAKGYRTVVSITQIQVTGEAVGTGDGSTTTFDLAHAAVDVSTLVAKVGGVVRTVTLSKGTGAAGVDQIIFGTAPAGAAAITADYKYGDDLHLTVNAAFETALAAETVQKYDYASTQTVAVADVIEFNDCTLEPKRNQITRAVINRSLDEREPITGDEEPTGNIAVELHGSGVAGTPPETLPLWRGGVGESRVSGTSLTVIGIDVNHVELDTGDGANHRVGEAILIDPSGNSVFEAVFITAINGDTLTVSPPLSEVHDAALTIGPGVHLKTSLTDLVSLYVQYFRGDVSIEKYRGCVVESVTADFGVGATINPTFAMQARDTLDPVNGVYDLVGTPTFDAGMVHVGRYMVIKLGGQLVPLESLAFTLANTLVRRKALTTAGTYKMMRTGRAVTGSFTQAMENTDIEMAFRNGIKAELMFASSEGNANLTPGNVFAARCPLIRYTDVPKNKADGIFRYNVSFKSAPVLGEDTFYASFL